ncbi:MAG TPA: nicotinate phosphoribosyltransferase [Candidatus Paceibacterota bacterium]
MKLDKPIITSLLQNDFYKIAMWLFIWKHFPDVKVTLGFKNRTLSIPLAKHVEIGEIREQFDHARTIRLSRGETKWIAGTDEYGSNMFPAEFIESIKEFSLPEYLLEKDGDNFRIEFLGSWFHSTQWEIPCLLIVNTLLNRARLRNFSRAEQECVRAQGMLNLLEKITRIKSYRYTNEFTFSDFGTRRCFSPEWQEHVVGILKEEFPSQFRGTSNCYLAQKYDLMPMGTRAHELDMIVAAIAGDNDDKVRQAPFEVCRRWSPSTFGKGLQTHLPDTFSSDYFFKHAPPELAEWKAVRQDSGDPYILGEKAIRWYESHGKNAAEKVLIPSDGLNIDLMLKLHAHFRRRISVSPGWGTNLTNDMGFGGIFKPVSIVVKPIEANGLPTVKLSDNIAKAIGNPKEIERYKKIFHYTSTTNQACIY